MASAAFADVTMTLDYVYSGKLDNSGYLVATFADLSANTVQLTLDTTNLPSTEWVSEWDFNVADVYTATSALTFTPAATAPSVALNTYKADGDGRYDISFTTQFNGGGTYIYTIAGSGLTAAAFDFLSVRAPGSEDYKGPFRSAAHVQGSGSAINTWVADVPDGGVTVMLLGGALLVLESLRRRCSV